MTNLLTLLAVLLLLVVSSAAQADTDESNEVMGLVVLNQATPTYATWLEIGEALGMIDGQRNLRHDARELCSFSCKCCTVCAGFAKYNCWPYSSQCKGWDPNCCGRVCGRRLEEVDESGRNLEVRFLNGDEYEQCAAIDVEERQLIFENGRFTYQAWNIIQHAQLYCVEIVEIQDSLLWIEDFSLQDGAKYDDGATSWVTSCTTETTSGTTSCAPENTGVFEVKDGELMLNGGETLGVLTTAAINISGHDKVEVSLDLYSQGDLEGGGDLRDYVELYVKVDNNEEELLQDKDGSQGSQTSPKTISKKVNLEDDSSKLVVIIKAFVSGNSKYYFLDNLRVEVA